MKPSRLIVCAVATAVASSLHAGDTEIIIESFPDGLNSGAFRVESGNWLDSAAKSTAPGLKGSKSKFNTADANIGVARFIPDIPVTGTYRVFFTYPKQGNAKGVIYRVVSADGTREFQADQNGSNPNADAAANKWLYLGSYKFEKGTNGYIEIADPGTGERAFEGEPNARVYADAIKLEPEGFTLPPDYVNVVGGGAGAALTPISTPATASAANIPPLTQTAPALPPISQSDSLPSLASSVPGPKTVASGGLPSLTAATAGSSSSSGSPSSSSVPSLPSLTGGSSPSAGSSDSSTPTGLPSLASSNPSAGSSSGSSAPSGLPSLGAVVGSSAGAASSSSSSSSTGLPVLGSSSTASPGAGSPSGLPSLASAGSASNASSSGLPSLSAVAGSSDSGSAPSTGLPSLSSVTGGADTAASPSSSGSGLPSLASAVGASSPSGGSGLPSLASVAGSSATSPNTGLPSLPGSSSSSSSSDSGTGLPSLPGLSGGSSAPSLPSLAEATGSGGNGSGAATGLPSLPSLSSSGSAAGSDSSPAGMPSLGSAVASSSSAPPSLPSLSGAGAAAPSSSDPGSLLAALGSAPAPAPSSAASASPSLPSSLPVPSAPAAPSSQPAAPAAFDDGGSSLQWGYDFGAALNTARAENRKVLVFFTAEGNRAAAQYESRYFTDPAVRAMLDKYVLVKVDFPRSTQLGYQLGIYGAGMIAVTDPTGTKIGSILRIPATPEDFIKEVEAIK